jgi:hypothetical protein
LIDADIGSDILNDVLERMGFAMQTEMLPFLVQPMAVVELEFSESWLRKITTTE